SCPGRSESMMNFPPAWSLLTRWQALLTRWQALLMRWQALLTRWQALLMRWQALLTRSSKHYSQTALRWPKWSAAALSILPETLRSLPSCSNQPDRPPEQPEMRCRVHSAAMRRWQYWRHLNSTDPRVASYSLIQR